MGNTYEQYRVRVDMSDPFHCFACSKEIDPHENACFGEVTLCWSCFKEDFEWQYSKADIAEVAGFIYCTPLELYSKVFGPARWYNPETAYMVMAVYDKAVKEYLTEEVANGIWNKVCRTFPAAKLPWWMNEKE